VSSERRRESYRFYLKGLQAYDKGNIRAAEAAFARAVSADPSNHDAVLDLKIAQSHLEPLGATPGQDKKLPGGKKSQPGQQVVKIAVAPSVADSVRGVQGGMDTLENATVEMAPSIQTVPRGGKQVFHLRGPISDVIREVLNAFGVTALVSDQVGSTYIPFETEEVDYDTAATLVRLASGTVFVPLDGTRVLVVKDTKQNREALERKLTETIYLPGLTPEEMSNLGNLATDIFKVDKVFVEAASETMTVRAAEATLDAMNTTLANLLVGQSQALLDLHLYEVDQSKTRNIGVQLPQSSTVFNVDSEVRSLINNNQTAVNEIVSSGLVSAGDTLTIAEILVEEGYGSGVLTEPFAVFGNGLTLTGLTMGTVTGNLSLSGSNARTLYKAQVRVQNNQTTKLISGTRYPVSLSNYTLTNYSATTGAASSTTTPQIQYIDLGLTLKITPRVETSNRLRMALDLQIRGLAGSSINDIPVLTSRSVTTEFSVGDGRAMLVASNLSRDETSAVNAVPGLSELSGFQNAANKNGQLNASELVLVITPYLLKSPRLEPYSAVTLLDPHD
jgi:type II secretory pathway component GspD/PulD (secretin)